MEPQILIYIYIWKEGTWDCGTQFFCSELARTFLCATGSCFRAGVPRNWTPALLYMSHKVNLVFFTWILVSISIKQKDLLSFIRNSTVPKHLCNLRMPLHLPWLSATLELILEKVLLPTTSGFFSTISIGIITWLRIFLD